MTTPNPTPAEREREAARELILNRLNGIVMDAGWYKDFIDELAAALAEAERGALTRAAEVANRTPVPLCYPIGFSTEIAHNIERETRYSIAAAIERLRDGEKG